jgi:hypothetical protein
MAVFPPRFRLPGVDPLARECSGLLLALDDHQDRFFCPVALSPTEPE